MERKWYTSGREKRRELGGSDASANLKGQIDVDQYTESSENTNLPEFIPNDAILFKRADGEIVATGPTDASALNHGDIVTLEHEFSYLASDQRYRVTRDVRANPEFNKAVDDALESLNREYYARALKHSPDMTYHEYLVKTA